MHFIDLLPGIIWAGFMGLAIGNFVTNPIYRLPRNEPLFLKDPYCGDCNTKLQPRDLFPVFSWLLTRGRCRYCGASVPGAYTVTEALIGILFVLCYLQFGFSEAFLLIAFGSTAFVMIAMMLYIDNFFSDRTLAACLTFGMLYRTLQEGTIYGFAGSAFCALLVSVVVWKCSGRPLARDMGSFPMYLKLLVAAGVWLTIPQLCPIFLGALLSIGLRKHRAWLTEWVIITGTVFLMVTHIPL